MKLVTFNIRIESPMETQQVNNFIHRAGGILEKIHQEAPDVICFQEVTNLIRDFLRRHLTDYTMYGHGREADCTGESCVVAVKNGMFELLNCDTFWLSDTPDVPGSKFPEGQSRFPRICTVVRLLRCCDKQIFTIYNTHLDFFTDEVSLAGMKLVFQRVQEDRRKWDTPFFITGDLNSMPDSPTITYANRFTNPAVADLTASIPCTNHDFGLFHPKSAKIDYIFTDEQTAKTVQDVYIWDDVNAGIYLSDHYPVCAVLDF